MRNRLSSPSAANIGATLASLEPAVFEVALERPLVRSAGRGSQVLLEELHLSEPSLFVCSNASARRAREIRRNGFGKRQIVPPALR